ncbi:MAG TPA: hypothetical protein VJ901_11725 [Thermoanaerobaculia bacterium]|nr:hypothetical protein [Thermoanaerobaculia bacterium]
MGKGRWAAVGCASLFALPFCAAGIATIFSAGQTNAQELTVRVAAGSAFIVFGLAIIFGALAVSNATAHSFELRRRYPDRPWMWRRDWAANAINDAGMFRVGMMWVFAIIWSLISLPLLFVFPWREVRESPIAVLPFLFPTIGAILLISVLYKSAQRWKYGASICHIDHMPIAPGHTFHGEIETRVRDMPPSGFNVRLTCMRRIGTGKSSSQKVEWQETQNIALATPSYEGAHVPFSFAIPADAATSGESYIVWSLDAWAEVPGIDYKASFELPVYATEAPPEIAWPAPQIDASQWMPDPKSHITMAPTPSDGEEFHVGPATTGRASFLLISVIWWGVIYLMVRFRAPMIFSIIFGAIGLFIVILGIDWMIGRSVVRADRASMSIRRTWLGIGGTRTIQPRDVTAISTSIGGVQNGVALYDVIVICGAKKFTAAKYVSAKRDAEMIAARLRRAIGIKAESNAGESLTS